MLHACLNERGLLTRKLWYANHKVPITYKANCSYDFAIEDFTNFKVKC